MNVQFTGFLFTFLPRILAEAAAAVCRQIPGIPPAWQAAPAFFRIVFSDIAYTFRYGKRRFMPFSGVIIRYSGIRNSGSGVLPAFSLKGIPLQSKIYDFHSAAQQSDALLQQKQPRQCPGCFCSGLPFGAPYPTKFLRGSFMPLAPHGKAQPCFSGIQQAGCFRLRHSVKNFLLQEGKTSHPEKEPEKKQIRQRLGHQKRNHPGGPCHQGKHHRPGQMP